MPVGYYVSVVRSSTQRGLLAGPFATHAEALDLVDAARREACVVDPWCNFDLFGTCRLRGGSSLPHGRLNERLGVVPTIEDSSDIGDFTLDTVPD